ncbi:MAG: hypothetical protein ABL982_00980, partial [Vicinamibacterales bacterium]
PEALPCGGDPMTRRVALLSAAALLLPRLASACPVCFGASDGPMLEGSNMGILALLVVTLAMLGAFGAFFYTLARGEARTR